MTRCLLVTATIDFWHPTGTYFIPRRALAPLLAPAGDPGAEPPSAPANGHRQAGAG